MKSAPSLRSVLFALGATASAGAGAATAQNVTVVPAIASTLPGNAAVATPLRWSAGVSQTIVEFALLPAALHGQSLTGLRLRRPAFVDEPAYGVLTRNLTVKVGFTSRTAANLSRTLAANRPGNLATVFGPAQLQVAATAAAGRAQVLGHDYVFVPFAAPIAVPATAAGGNLFVEFELVDTALTVSNGHWVDAVWVDDGVENGYVANLGSSGCGTGGEPRLVWNGATGPRVGGEARLLVSGGGTSTPVVVFFGLEPQARAPGGLFAGFGGPLDSFGMTGCVQWTPLDGSLAGLTSPLHSFQFTMPIPATGPVAGMRIGVQAALLNQPVNPAGIVVSNGVLLVLDNAGVGNRCASVFAPGVAPTMSPWPIEVGLMPVLGLEY